MSPNMAPGEYKNCHKLDNGNIRVRLQEGAVSPDSRTTRGFLRSVTFLGTLKNVTRGGISSPGLANSRAQALSLASAQRQGMRNAGDSPPPSTGLLAESRPRLKVP